jgi:hypothetical protein
MTPSLVFSESCAFDAEFMLDSKASLLIGRDNHLACQDLIESGTQGAHLATEHRRIARTDHRQLLLTGKCSLASVSVCAYILLATV